MTQPELSFPSTGPVADAAQRIAAQAHQGQLDKSGVPYLSHPARVAAWLHARGQVDAIVAAGWLHDVLEDTSWTAAQLSAAGMPARTLQIVQAMTRMPGQHPEDYYAGLVAAGPEAVAVKLADIDDNTDPARTVLLDGATRERLAKKYAKARLLLGA